MKKTKAQLQLEKDVVVALKEIFDPEIPVNIYDLGLIYDVSADSKNNVNITMTLTTPQCPVAETLPVDVEITANNVEGVNKAHVVLTFDPPWSKKKPYRRSNN